MKSSESNETRAFRIFSKDADKMLESRYSISEVVDMIKNGVVGLSVDSINGVNNATYVKAPRIYEDKGVEWSNTEFYFDGKPHDITTATVDGASWYHLPQILKMINLYTAESDSRAFETGIPYGSKRRYSPWGKGIKRTFVTMEALENFGISSDGKPKAKRKVSLQYTGVTTYNVNLNNLTNNVRRIMDKLPSLDDKVFMCDVYRVLKQLE